jgi:hypothetical protein
MFVVDDCEFVFSWFPSDGPSAENVCFHLSGKCVEPENLRAIERLKLQLEAVRKTRKIVTLSSSAAS